MKLGIGYYKYVFINLNNNNAFGHGTARPIGYPSPLYILFTTDRYWYNTLSANLGFEQVYKTKYDMQIMWGVNLHNYLTYAQHYHITYRNRDNPINNDYITHYFEYFGSSLNLQVGIIKQVGKLQVGPAIILPIYDSWKKNKVFGENKNEYREKWFEGIGIGIIIKQFIYSVNK